MIYRCILANWAYDSGLPKVVEGALTTERIHELNAVGYNIYFLPNYPSNYENGTTVDGSQVDTFNFVFVDMDLKEGKWASKEDFTQAVSQGLKPSLVVDSGNGVHVYWEASDLDAMSFLRLQRRLTRAYKTDEAVSKIYQLMRVPGTVNVKLQGAPKQCTVLDSSDAYYTCEELDAALPPITKEDEAYCVAHYNKTHNIHDKSTKLDDKLPLKFATLLSENKEVKEIWAGGVDDRSKSDYRLGHIMFASGFTKAEATSVLVNSAKALNRSPVHRVGYATGIIDKIWTHELAPSVELNLSQSVKSILAKSGDVLKGTRFPCHRYLDDTAHGFRLGQVIGLVAGSGVGKTAIALNMFMGFVKNNPDYDHIFIPLEQPANEIAERWRDLCGDNTQLHEKVQVISNYGDSGEFRHLSLTDIRKYILKYQVVTGRKVGCVVIDHVGALKKTGKDGENQGIMDICHEMKAFAIETNTMLVMQSQAPREKAGIGDLELNKDAAYGTVYFESYCDYLITLWQPLKRSYSEGAPTVTAYKFCKIRHKKQGTDRIQEDVCYSLHFDPNKGILRELTQDEEKAVDFFNKLSTNKRKADRKTDLVTYVSMRDEPQGVTDGEINNSQDALAASGARGLPV